MPTPANKIRIFVASPGDVQPERDQLSKVVSELNLTISAIAPDKGIVLELIKWETHVRPGLGRDAQDVVNQQIGDYDIFVGILWKRLGTPTAVANSGTEEEFRRAYAEWEKNRSLPILFYFCQAPFGPPATQDEVEQLGKVIAFRTELSQKGLLWEYADHAGFADVIRPHLILVLSNLLSKKHSPMEVAEDAGRFVPESDVSATKEQILALAQEYEDVRKAMPPGGERTRRMSAIAARMRVLGLSVYPLLPELTISPSPGQRLAAVSTLQVIPNPEYLPWLADRLGVEKPFVGYQASVAILTAARSLAGTHKNEIQMAIKMARNAMDGLKYEDPNQVYTIDEAQKELDGRAG